MPHMTCHIPPRSKTTSVYNLCESLAIYTLNIYIYICKYIYIKYIHVHIYIYICIYIVVYSMHVCMYVCIYECMCVCMHVYSCDQDYMNMRCPHDSNKYMYCIYKCMCCIYIYIHTCIYNIYIYI